MCSIKPITLYKVVFSPASKAVTMVVELLGLEVDTVIINTLTNENLRPDFVEKNPLHAVPFIEDGDFSLGDSHAIITYLVTRYGGPKSCKWYPQDMYKRATIDHRMYMEATLFFPKFRATLAAMVNKKRQTPLPEHVADVEKSYGYLEKYLEKTRYVATDHITVADISCVASVSSLNILIPISCKFPKLSCWLNSLKEEDWYQKGNEPGLAMLQDIVDNIKPECSNYIEHEC